MKRETYLSIFEKINRRKYGVLCLKMITKLLTYLTILIYGGVVIYYGYQTWLGKESWTLELGFVLVPGISFVLVNLFRQKYNAPRPYEVFDFVPLIPKSTLGQSFPSRHVFSIFVISSCVACINPLWGAIMLAMGVVLAVLRVVTGVHFPKDVIAGAVIGELCGFFLLFFL